MTRFILPASAVLVAGAALWVGSGCTDTIVKTIPAGDGGRAAEPDAKPPEVVNPSIDAGPDSGGVPGRRLGDLGCQESDDCDSNVCFIGTTESFCTRDCSPSTAATDCPKPLNGTCSRQFYCDRAE